MIYIYNKKNSDDKCTGKGIFWQGKNDDNDDDVNNMIIKYLKQI